MISRTITRLSHYRSPSHCRAASIKAGRFPHLYQMPQEVDPADIVHFTPDRQTAKAIADFKNGSIDQEMVFINGRNCLNKPYKIHCELEALGDIIVSEYGHSILVRFTDPEDQDQFIRTEECAANLMPEGVTYKDSLREDKFFLKLKTKDGRYTASFNPPMLPTAPEKSNIHQGSLLDIEYQPNIWINFKSATGGVFLNVNSITVDGGKKKNLARKR